MSCLVWYFENVFYGKKISFFSNKFLLWKLDLYDLKPGSTEYLLLAEVLPRIGGVLGWKSGWGGTGCWWAIEATAAATVADSAGLADKLMARFNCRLDVEILWIFFMWTFRWSVLLNTWPHCPQGCGTKRPWCWWRTCRSRVHLRLKHLLQAVQRYLTPSGVWHME